MSAHVSIKLTINQTVLRENPEIDGDILECLNDPDPYFIEDSFEHLNLKNLNSSSNLVQVKAQKESYTRILSFSVDFDVDNAKDLKEFLEDEMVLEEDDFDGHRFLTYYIGDLDSLNVGEDDDGDFISVEFEDVEVEGSIDIK